MAAAVKCPGCGALVPDTEELRSRNLYVEAAPGCFAAYTELIGIEQSNPALIASHMLAADAYPSQHPGVPGRQSSRSVRIHLVGLCLSLEHGFDGVASARAKARLAAPDAVFDWLEPPAHRGSLTVLDAIASAPEEHAATVRHWADSVWQAWEPHQALVRATAATLLKRR